MMVSPTSDAFPTHRPAPLAWKVCHSFFPFLLFFDHLLSFYVFSGTIHVFHQYYHETQKRITINKQMNY